MSRLLPDDLGRVPWWLGAAGGVFVLAVAYLVASSLVRPSPPTRVPSSLSPDEVGDSLVEDRVVTLDTRNREEWRRFDFSRGAPVPGARGSEWDLAARRYRLIVNGGEQFAGRAGVVSLGTVPFDSVRRAPAEGYRGTRRDPGGDPEHPVLDGWYRYDFFSHLLLSRGRVFAVRTADGRYAKVAVVSYYCPGPEPGCLTIRYSYQGEGSRRVAR